MTAAVEERTAEAEPADAPQDKNPAPKRREVQPVDEYASYEDLLNKAPRTKDVPITVGDKTLKVKLEAIGNTAYDQLVAANPPTADQRDQGASFNVQTFAPALIAAVVSRPKMNLDQVTRLWKDPNWSGGEAGGLYRACVELCQAGLDIPFTGIG